jgi:hypothetical protein
MQEIYVATADDRDAQMLLAEKFNKEWKVGKKRMTVVIIPNAPAFNSLSRTFSNEEMQDFGKKTIYFMFRFEYSDGTGRWRMDECEAFQRTPENIDATVAHPCEVFVNARYPVKPQ